MAVIIVATAYPAPEHREEVLTPHPAGAPVKGAL